MVAHAIVANDEHPSWPIKLGYKGVAEASWPPIPDDGAQAVKVTFISQKVKDAAGTKVTNAAAKTSQCAIVNRATRLVRKDFAAGQYPNADVGEHEVQWQITYPDGTSETWPGPGEFDTLTVGRDLDNGTVA